MNTRSRLQAVGEDEATLIGEEPPRPAEAALTSLLMMSLQSLSQRAVVALASIVDLALFASVFALILMVVDAPTPIQLTAIGGYAVFVLVSIWMRRR